MKNTPARMDCTLSVLMAARDRGLLVRMQKALAEAGIDVSFVADGSTALERLHDGRPDALFCSEELADMPGVELLRYARRRDPDLPVVFHVKTGSEALAVEVLTLGAHRYLGRDASAHEVVAQLRGAAESGRLRHAARIANDAAPTRTLIGTSPPMVALRGWIADVAPTDATVLVLGETGTGKELIARAVHAASRRSKRPFVPVNCAAIPDALLEAELFGYVRGAFTGADHPREGRLVSAHQGTLFLDEIGDLPPALQPKLLRALEDSAITPLGSDAAKRISVRFIAATHKDLAEEVRAGRFREDLFYRLCVVPVRVPPLRERRTDIAALVRHLLPRLATRHGRTLLELDARLLPWLEAQEWPGNVRELENTLERLVVFMKDGVVRPAVESERAQPLREFAEEKRKWVGEFEREYLRTALGVCGGHLGETARRTGISARQLYNLIHKHGLHGSLDSSDSSDATLAEPRALSDRQSIADPLFS